MRFVLLVLLPFLAQAAPAKLAIEDAADTYLNAAEPNRNFGTAPLLALESERQTAILHFDLAKVPRANALLSARLTLTFESAASGYPDTTFYAAIMARDFVETQATFLASAQNQPWTSPGMSRSHDYSTEAVPYRSAFIYMKGGGGATIDLTTPLRQALIQSKTSFNVAIFSDNGTGRIFGRRSPDASKRPLLEITYDATAPKSVAGRDAIVDKPGAAIPLDGSASARPDGSKNNLAYLWTVQTPAPASTFSPGQELAHTAAATFEPDVPGLWKVRLRVTDPATKEFTEDSVNVTSLAMHAHPRLGINEKYLEELRELRKSKRPVWMRFQEFLDSKEKGGREEVVFGINAQAFLLAWAVTKERKYFDMGWPLLARSLYRNGKDRSGGLKPFVGRCGEAEFCDNHTASGQGSFLMMAMAHLYDWGYDALDANQRQDIIAWLNAAVAHNYLDNENVHTHFRNDGAGILVGLAVVAYGTWGDNPYASQTMAWFRQEWSHTLEALDVMGRGGAMAEGNAYGEASAGAIIQVANMVYYADGENLFQSHPFFQRRLAYDTFTTYPNRLREADYVFGHTNPPTPFIEGAALGGDDDRGPSWHSLQLRPVGLMLSRRFPGTEEADLWNWVFRQANVDQSDDAWVDVYLYSPPPPLKKPKRLSFFDPALGYIYLRSDWNSRDATWISSWAGMHLDLHQHLDQGAFTIFKRRDLAIKSGNYDYNPLTPHVLAYSSRSVSANTLLVGDPHENFGFFIAGYGCGPGTPRTLLADTGACIPNDGGERTMMPYSLSLFSVEDYYAHRDAYDVAHVVSFQDNGKVAAWSEDITNAYSNPRWHSLANKPKVTKVYRKFVYLREPDALIVADTVESVDPSFEKSWLLHTVDRFEVGGQAQEVSPGESVHTDVNQARVVVDDKKPANKDQPTSDLRSGFGGLLIETLFPAHFHYRLIGGRDAAPKEHQAQYQPDPKALQGGHFHTHIKDYWVKDYGEGVLPDHKSRNWAPVYPQEMSATMFHPIFSGGYGRWRLEVQPTEPAKTDYFLNVLKPTINPEEKMPEMTKFETPDSFGVTFKGYKVSFSKNTLDAPQVEGVDLTAPMISNVKPSGALPAGTKQTTLSLSTSEPSVCRYSFRSGTMFPYMSGAFTSTDGLSHTLRAPNLQDGDTYTYFVRCQDKSGNENLEDLRITFAVAGK